MVPVCDKCGVESESGQPFPKKRKAFRKKEESHCPDCLKKRERSEKRTVFFWAMLVFIVAVLVSKEAQGTSFVQVLINWGVTVYVLIPLSVFAHELGHALAAVTCRFRLFSVELGWHGKELFNCRILGTRWILRWFPESGLCRSASPKLDHLRWRFFLVVAAGPLTNLLIIALIVLNKPSGTLLSLGPYLREFDLLYLLFWSNVFLLLSSLRKKDYCTSIGEVHSDGSQLLRLLKNDQKLLEESHKAYFIFTAADFLSKEQYSKAESALSQGLELYPNDVGLEITRCDILYRLDNIDLARDQLTTILEKTDPKDSLLPTIKNNLAYYIAVLGDEQRYPEADILSTEALQAQEAASHVIGTRGSVLIRLGRAKEGLDLLNKSIKECTSEEGRGENLTWVAFAYWKLNAHDKARDYLQQARSLAPKFPLFDEVTRLLDAQSN